jgi:hypothetical protein
MSRTDAIRQALEILGATPQPKPDQPRGERPELHSGLHLANGLLGVAEREIIEAELEAARSGLTPSDIDTVTSEAELDVDAAAGWIDELEEGKRAVLHWRAARLHSALARALPESTSADPLLGAAHDAAALTTVLLGYREAAELQLSDPENTEYWQGIPESALNAAIMLLGRLTETLRGLTT